MVTLNGSPLDSTPDGEHATEALLRLALTNYGHFTTMRVEPDKTVRGLALHLERLQRDCRAVFEVDLDTDRVRGFIRSYLTSVNGPVSLRITVFDASIGLGNIAADAHPDILVTSSPSGPMAATPLTTVTVPFTRDAAAIKHVGLWSQMRLRRGAQRQGAGDVIFVEPDGTVSEGATWNLGFITAGGDVVWPSGPVLPGVTMQLIQQAQETSGVAQKTSPVHLDDLGTMSAAFATNVSVGVRGIASINDVSFDVEHPALDLMRKAYGEVPSELV
ncbi:MULTISPECIES: aminotransferase class IV [Arthrobacter]|uniref:Aminotransferase n=1 Tax=Arthrobacter terricola TaxID=2547396 RepID=A0A4R5K944_9MICC|nr:MULTISPECIES: aminotransferase class IV [Arthrobacter]MBT8162928.1 aminotransferase class IV [Arthrobacter sp. GN70]TDF91661.1 aminotransferase [Arthrobacter terricola]